MRSYNILVTLAHSCKKILLHHSYGWAVEGIYNRNLSFGNSAKSGVSGSERALLQSIFTHMEFFSVNEASSTQMQLLQQGTRNGALYTNK